MEEYRYRKTSYKCSECKFSFEKLRKFAVSKYPHGTDLPFPRKDPECPQCSKDDRVKFKNSVTTDTHGYINPDNEEAQISGGTPENPQRSFSMGGSAGSKAFDKTAEIVMKDYGMTDINMNSNSRDGDNMVPKLRPDLEARVNKGWGNKPNNVMGMQSAGASINTAITNQINSNSFKGSGDVVARQQKTGYKVPTRFVGEYDNRGKPN